MLMKIAKIIINNFRGISTEVIEPERLNVFLGRCGTGKSSSLDAIRWGLIGDISKEDIRYDTPEASVKIIFDDETSITRTRSLSKSSCYVNEKGATERATNEFIENKIGCPIASLAAMCGVSFIQSLSKKDLKAFFVGMLPIRASFDKLIELSGETNDEKIQILKRYLPEDITLSDIDAAYKTVFDERKMKKQLLKNLQEKSKFIGSLPETSKEDLLKRQGEISLLEAQRAEYKNNLTRYNNSVKAREAAEKQLLTLKAKVESMNGVDCPDEAELQKCKMERQQFVDAITNSQNALAAIKANLNLLEKTLESLDKPICPLSEKLICSTDKTGLKSELIALIEMNRKNIRDGNDFVVRCQDQVEKRDVEIDNYNKRLAAWKEKSVLETQIKSFILPEVLDKPKDVTMEDLTEEKELIQNQLNIWTEKDVADRSLKEIEKIKKEVHLYEYAVKFLSSNGVKVKLLEKAITPLQTMVDKKTSSLKKGFNISLTKDGEFDITISPRNKDLVPINKISTGEFVITAYILMSVVSQITGVSLLMIDNIDTLDADAARQLMILLDTDENFDTIFVSGVDHPDTIEAISEADCLIKEYV